MDTRARVIAIMAVVTGYNVLHELIKPEGFGAICLSVSVMLLMFAIAFAGNKR